jgi:SPP1 gp7 family putative phage head morphogenesis protein
MTGMQFMEAIVLALMLPTRRTPGGQCFLIPDDVRDEKITNFRRGEIPGNLYPFSDEHVYPVVQNGVLIRWDLKIPGNQVLKLMPDEVIRIHLYNPYSLLLGMSPYAAAVYSVENDLKTAELARKFSDNSANLGGMLTTDATLTQDQAQELRTEWENRYAGPGKSGRTAILHSGLKYEQTSRSLVDLQWAEQKQLNKDAILAAYRVPGFMVAQAQDTNYATAIAAVRVFWETSLLPLAESIWEPINSQWVENIPPGNWLAFSDTSQVEALRKDYKDKILIAQWLIQQGTPAAEAYRILDIPVDGKRFPWLEEPLVMGSRVNLKTGEVIGQPTFGFDEPFADDGEGDTGPAVGEGEKMATPRLRVRADAKDRFWLGWVKRSLTPVEKRLQTGMARYFISQRNAMQDRVDEWARSPAAEQDITSLLSSGDGGLKARERAGHLLRAIKASTFLLDLREWNALLKSLANPIYDQGISLQAKELEDELGEFINWNQNSPYVESIKRERAQFLQMVNTSTMKLAADKVNEAIEEARAAGATVDETANLIKDKVGEAYGIRLHNAPTIARTEMASIASSTRQSIFEKEGIEKHEWLSARDERTRATHLGEDGHQVKVGDRFPVTGLLHPGEIGAPIEETVNCRCVCTPIIS